MGSTRHIVIVGGGGFGREVACWIEQAAAVADIDIRGFLDDTRAPCDALGAAYPYPVLGSIIDYRPQAGDGVVIAIGDPRARLRIAAALTERGANFHSLVHPTAVIARTARLGRGSILCPHAMVSADAVVGDFVIVNAYTGVGHDCVIGDGTTLCSHVDLTGGVKLGEGVFVGSSAAVLPDVEVGAQAVIGAGSVVLRRVEPGSTIYAPLSKKL